jgi:MFS family permease
MPFQVAFGFGSSFVPYYVFGTVVDDSAALGREWVGILAAFIVLSGAMASIPAAKLANVIGKSAVVSFGAVALTLSCSMFFFFSDRALGTWTGIIPLLLLYGVGRGIWENTNKAVMADFYAEDKDSCISAFAASSFFTGYASAMGYFVFPYSSRTGMAGVCVFSGILGLICYRLAFIVHRHLQHSKSIDKNAILKTQYRAHLLREKVGIRQAYATNSSSRSPSMSHSQESMSYI